MKKYIRGSGNNQSNLRKRGFTISLVPLAACFLCVLGVLAAGLSSAPHKNWDSWGAHEKQYEALTAALVSGSLSLKEEPAPFLGEMENPYDPAARSIASGENGSYALIDVAYFGGEYYVYFGLTPALLIFLPARILTGRIIPTWIAVIAVALLCVPQAFIFIHCLLGKVVNGSNSPATEALLGISLISALGIPYLAAFCTSYSMPDVTGVFLTLLGLSLFLSTGSPRGNLSRPRLILGSVVLALTVGCRPCLIFSFLLLFPIYKDEIKGKAFFYRSKTAAANTLSVLVPVAIVVSFFLAYNALRFNNPFDFGYKYLLTTRDLLHDGKSAGEMLESLRLLTLALSKLKAHFPFMDIIEYDGIYSESLYVEPLFGGLFPLHPVLASGLIILVILCLKKDSSVSNNRYLIHLSLTSLMCGAVILIIDSAVAGVSQRYLSDFALFFFIPAACTLACVCGADSWSDERESPVSLTGGRKPFQMAVFALLVLLTCLEVYIQFASIVCDGRYFAMRDWNPEVYEVLANLLR